MEPVGSCLMRTPIGTLGKTMKLRAIRRFCNRLLDMIILNCWRVNESWIVDITELLTQKLSAVFATNSSLELGGDECNNLNFKIDCIKIRKKNREFYELLKFVKFEFSVYVTRTTGSMSQGPRSCKAVLEDNQTGSNKHFKKVLQYVSSSCSWQQTAAQRH